MYYDFWLDAVFIAADTITALVICDFVIRFTGASRKPQYYLLLCAIYLLVDLALIWAEAPDIWPLALNICIITVFCFLVLGSGMEKAFTSALIVVTVRSITSNLSASVMEIARVSMRAGEVYAINFVMMAATILIIWFVLRYLNVKISLGRDGQLPYIYTLWLPMIMILFFSELFVSLYTGNTVVIDESGYIYTNAMVELSGYVVLGIFIFAMFCFIILVHTYKKLVENYDNRRRADEMKGQVEWYRKAVADARMRYDRTRAYRHDLNNHLGVLGGLLDKESAVEAKEYLERLRESAASVDYSVNTGSAVLDVLLGEKYVRALQTGIKVESDVTFKGGWMDEYDMCILLGNALDNAIAACEGMTGGEPFIDVAVCRKKDFVLVSVKNSKGEHMRHGEGYGMRNMRDVAEKYNGRLDIMDDGDIFELTALLSVPQQKEAVPQQND